MALRNAYKQRPRESAIKEEPEDLNSVHSVEQLTRGGRRPAPPGPVNPNTAQNFISDQFDFLQKDQFSPYNRYADGAGQPGPREDGNANHGIRDNFSFGPPSSKQPTRSFSGTRPEGDGSDTDSIGLAKDLMSRFNHGFVPDQPDGYTSVGGGYASNNNTRVPPSGRDMVYTTGNDPRGYSRGRPNYEGNGVATAFGGTKPPVGNNGVATAHVGSRESHAYPAPPAKKDSYYARNKRCMLAVILVIVALIVLAVVAILVLFFLGFFDSSPPLNVKYDGEVRFNVTWTSDLENKTSESYKKTSDHFTSLMAQVLDNTTHNGQYEVELTDTLEGSIRCFFTMLLSSVDESIESTVDRGLKKLFDEGITDWYTEYTSIKLASSTEPPTTQEPTTLMFTTPGRITPPPAPTCKPIPEPLCTVFDYDKTGNANAPRFSALYPSIERECYTHALLYACTSSFPVCAGNLERYPCQRFCDDFMTNCSFPVNCAGYHDDDVSTLCYMSPDPLPTEETVTRNPVPEPCEAEEYMCGDGHCIPEAQECDNVDQCGDHSDETNCAGLTSTLDCDFEMNTVCDYSNYGDGDFSWSLQIGTTPSLNTGPLTDHTLRTSQGHYVYAEASGQYPYSRAGLLSPEVTLENEWCLRFYYHMLGAQVEGIKIFQYFGNAEQNLLWQRSRDHGDIWRFGSVTLPVGQYQVLWQGTRGEGYLSDVAVDDITAREGACPTATAGCASDEFHCENDNCVTSPYVCDSFNDCGDLSDEKSCNCTAEEFQCGFGMCIPDYERCDGNSDCADGTDEHNCEGVCSNGRHKCADGTCIMTEWVCDHEEDCPDGSDELDCPACTTGQFQCRDHGCVNVTDICDGTMQCMDGSDEFQCFRTRDTDHLVEVNSDEVWKGLCAEGLPNNIADHVCKLMGYMTSLRHSVITVTGGSYVKFVASGEPADNFLAQLTNTDSCLGDEVYAVECVVPECGTQTVDHHAESQIVNGQDALPGQWPWQIGLYYNGFFSCGGSLVSHHHVITAAHCLKVSKDASRYQVILGATFREPSPDDNRVQVDVAAIHAHPGYTDAVWGDDIAVLTLDRYISFNDYIKPICLPNELDYFPTTAQCYTSGWGRTDYYNTSSVPLRLQEAKMKLWSDKKCGQAHISFKDSMTCAGYESGHISNCPGDSGGPLQCKDPHGYWKLYGAFSFFVRGCNVPLQPPVFTKVQSYLPWVLDNLDCVFICNNQRCIWDEDSVCNGVDDCGDMSDETTECSPSMTCSFDTGPYQCGYSYTDDISKSSWGQLTKSGTPNRGPITDISLGNSSGFFMYGGRDRSVLVSPIQDRATPSCVQFAYHLRGASAGTLQISTAQVPANVHHPSLVDLTSSETKDSVGGNQLDIWHSKRIDLAAGRFVVVFTAIAVSQQDLPLAAIDDVRLFDGACQSITCADDEVSCDGRCAPQEDVCNYHTLCLGGDDETDCNAAMTYSCDMETYGHCRLEQTLLVGSDSRDWTLLETEDFGNGPPGDHTTGQYGGHVLYLSTLVGIPGQSAVVQLSTKIPAGDHCLQFFYSMVSTGALRVYLCDNDLNCEIKWHTQDANVPGWEAVQMNLTTADNLVQIFGYTGSFSSGQDMGYISIDDISIEDGACSAPSCLWNEFSCSDGTCIGIDQICNTVSDCADGDDENAQTCECMPDMFQCGDGTCILGIFRCDELEDCADGSDEATCNTCGEDELVCTDDSTCRNRYVFCDGFDDCLDGSDEPTGCTCREDQFECSTIQGAAPGFCIAGIRYCDGFLDCSDGSDEPVAGCDSCDPRWHFDCGDGSCIPKAFVCDGVTQCANDQDENPVNCPFACTDASIITMAQYCDGVPHCSAAEDEPANCDCPFGYTACAGGGCVLATALCDGVYNCKDHSDELNCVCGTNTDQCTSGMCISSTAKCDSFVDCDDWSDELQCGAQCTTGQFSCDNGVCLPNILRCDGSDNCGDGSDEVGCVCGGGEISCPVERKCISLLWKCDGVEDCSDGFDEDSCPTCAANQFQCTNDKTCIAQSRRCDNTDDCTDGSDEAICERNDDSGFLESFKGDRWSTVCSRGWQNSWNNEICRRMGKGLALSSETLSSAADEFLVVAEGTAADSDFNTGLLALGTCAGSKGVQITCGDLTCGVSDPQVRPLIIGGSSVTDENKWPWMASLLYLGGPRCGATLINSQWLITAAHCFSGPSLNDPVLELVPGYFTVTLGTTKQAYMGSPDHQTEVRGVTTIITHPDYTVDNSKQGMLFNDIALVRLESPIAVSTSVRPLCFPKQGQVFNTKRECYSAGWGFVDSQSSEADFAPILDLRDGRLRTWTHEECSVEAAWGANVNSTVHVCAGLSSGAVATCHGDSGGPLMCRDLTGRWDLVGVTSAGSNCGQGTPPNRPGVFTRVAQYIDWINQQIATSR